MIVPVVGTGGNGAAAAVAAAGSAVAGHIVDPWRRRQEQNRLCLGYSGFLICAVECRAGPGVYVIVLDGVDPDSEERQMIETAWQQRVRGQLWRPRCLGDA